VDLTGIEPVTSSMPSPKKKCPSCALVSDPFFPGKSSEELPGQP
jgi:hypothetical protein